MESSVGSLHDEIYMAFEPLRKWMRFFGVFPIRETHSPGSMKSMVDGLQFRWKSVWVLHSLMLFITITISYKYLLTDYTFLIPNPMEGVIIFMFATILCWCANLNLVSTVIQAGHWPLYFKNWQLIDRTLDITHDGELRAYVQRLLAGVITLSVFSVITTTLTIVVKYVFGDFSGDGFVFTLIIYSSCVNACYLLPELFFAYLCKALTIRFQRLAKDINHLFCKAHTSSDVIEIANEMCKLRIVCQSLMEILMQTNRIMNPILMITCAMNTVTLSGGIYFLVRHSLGNIGFLMMKVILVVLSSSRLAIVCLHANTVKVEVKRMARVLYKAPSLKMTTESVHELRLFLRCIKNAKPDFTAWGFVVIDKELLSTVTSIIVTYTITLLQFDKDMEEDADMEIDCPNLRFK